MFVPGDTIELENEGRCRDVWLGTDRDEHFVREILFTISPSGAIYKYDAVYDVWTTANDSVQAVG